jgi:hypothetical protein
MEAIMKRGIIALAAAISIAGAASASIFTTPSEAGPQHVLVRNTASLPASATLSESHTSSAAKSVPVVLQRSSFESRQAPVPLQMKSRQPARLSTIGATEAYAMGEAGTVASSVSTNQFGENAARAAIEADGYKSVRVVSKSDGVWSARALRGTTEVPLTVDANGRVTVAD